ncbi:hypothetical protein HYFRA_00005491 [Hymenoscyphus fraxineus]|uniref:Uncharacterized protein n=1 Tax=Hymenoscyphus fraxineus TaxID=746836 RepID=A0A9N9KRC2_9HELO|nr:hypothetical protein HYFRA_00005491 [Hymenoscyphus fraxineus]
MDLLSCEYQEENRTLKAIGFNTSVAKSTDGVVEWDALPDIAFSNAAPSTAAALIPLGDLTTAKVPNLLKAYAESNQLIEEVGADHHVEKILVPQPQDTSCLTAILIYTADHGLLDICVFRQSHSGIITKVWCSDLVWGIAQAPSLKNSPKELNFSAIAMNEHRRTYGISLWKIHEFEIDRKNPFSWNYIGDIRI